MLQKKSLTSIKTPNISISVHSRKLIPTKIGNFNICIVMYGNKMEKKRKKNDTHGEDLSKIQRQIGVRGKIDTPNTHIHDRSLGHDKHSPICLNGMGFSTIKKDKAVNSGRRI
jgi:hypothetical protein